MKLEMTCLHDGNFKNIFWTFITFSRKVLFTLSIFTLAHHNGNDQYMWFCILWLKALYIIKHFIQVERKSILNIWNP